MFSRLPMYQRQGASAYRKDLTNIRILAEYLNHPEQDLKCVHVAGTNGKGSTSHMLASILMESGYKVGLYTSPHLKDFRERITVNGRKIPESNVIAFIDLHRSFFESHQLSFFEMTVGMAFDHFAKQEVDIAIIETGMGGRLDATNIIRPEVSVITNIALDHTQFLGDTLEKIAFEKAGIMKQGVPTVIGERQSETQDVFIEWANELNCDLQFASDSSVRFYQSDLKGNYQAHNQKTVLQTIRILRESEWKITDDAIIKGLQNIIKNTGLQGRWQQLRDNPIVICDTAHNRHGLEATLPQINDYTFDRLHIVLGTVNDKDLGEILGLFPKSATYYFCKPDIPRGLDAHELQNAASAFGLSGKCYSSVAQAYKAALSEAGRNDFIYIGGSTFVVAEIL